MPVYKLDAAGEQKMKTLEEALHRLQHLHAIVERMALAAKSHLPTAQFGHQLKREGTPLVGFLKGQYGSLADNLAAILLVATRGGSEQMKVRALRDGVAQLRTQIDIAMSKVKEHHSVQIGGESPGDRA